MYVVCGSVPQDMKYLNFQWVGSAYWVFKIFGHLFWGCEVPEFFSVLCSDHEPSELFKCLCPNYRGTGQLGWWYAWVALWGLWESVSRILGLWSIEGYSPRLRGTHWGSVLQVVSLGITKGPIFELNGLSLEMCLSRCQVSELFGCVCTTQSVMLAGCLRASSRIWRFFTVGTFHTVCKVCQLFRGLCPVPGVWSLWYLWVCSLQCEVYRESPSIV